MGYDLLVVGDGEVQYGLDNIDSLLIAHNLRAISNNILDAESGKLRYEPYAVLKAGHLKVGVTGMIGGKASVPRGMQQREGIEIADGLERSRNVLKTLRRKKVDVAILLAHTGVEQAKELADSLQGYDVILAGEKRKSLNEPEKRGTVVLAATGAGSSALGELTLTVESRRIVSFEGRSSVLNQDDGPVDQNVKELTWTKLELDEKGKRIRKKAPQKQPPKEKSTPQGAAAKADHPSGDQ